MGYKTKTKMNGWRHSRDNPVEIVAELIQPENPRFEVIDGEEYLLQDMRVAGPDVESKTYSEIHAHIFTQIREWEKTGIRLRGVELDDPEERDSV